MLLLRVSAIFPFTLINYTLGLTKISFRDFMLVSWLGMTPGIVLYVYLGSLAGSVAAPRPQHKNPVEWVLFALSALATVWMTAEATKMVKKVLKEQT